MPSVGMIIQHKERKVSGGVVILASDAGVLVWRLVNAPVHGARMYELRHDESGPCYHHLLIEDYTEWVAADSFGMAPSLLRQLLQGRGAADPKVPYKILGRAATEPEDLVQAACRKGFPERDRALAVEAVAEGHRPGSTLPFNSA